MTINATATHQQSAPPPILLNDRLRGHALWDCKEMEESAGAPPRFTVKYMAAGSVHHDVGIPRRARLLVYCVDRHEAEAIVERLTPTIVRGGSLVYIAMNLASGTSATSARESQLVELFRLHQRVSAIGDSPVYVVAMHSSLEWRNFLAELATAAMVRGNDAGGAFAMDMQQPVGMRALLQRITETSSGDAVRIHWSDYDADVLEDTFGSVQGLARALATAGTEALLDVPLERGKMMTIARFFDK